MSCRAPRSWSSGRSRRSLRGHPAGRRRLRRPRPRGRRPRRWPAGHRAGRRLRRRPRLPGAQHRLPAGGRPRPRRPRPRLVRARGGRAGRRPGAPRRRPAARPAPSLGTAARAGRLAARQGRARRVLRCGPVTRPVAPAARGTGTHRRGGAAAPRASATPALERFFRPVPRRRAARGRAGHLQPLPRPAVALLRPRRDRAARRRHAGRSASSSPPGWRRRGCTCGTRGARRRPPARCVTDAGAVRPPTPSSSPPTRAPRAGCSPAVEAAAPRQVTTHFHVAARPPRGRSR